MGMIISYEQIVPSKLEEIIKDPSIVMKDIEESLDEAPSADEISIDIDEADSGIDAVFNNFQKDGEKPLADAIYGSMKFEDEEYDFLIGSLKKEEVAKIAQALSSFKEEDFKSIFDSTDMEECGWEKGDLEYLLEHFNALKSFYQDASSKGSALLITVS
ncbi:MAG: DUF1877 family protein [Candidatus Paceibacterota bacterium]|jgi:hypothetical protein